MIETESKRSTKWPGRSKGRFVVEFVPYAGAIFLGLEGMNASPILEGSSNLLIDAQPTGWLAWAGYRSCMAPVRSPEIEAVVRRVLDAWQERDFEAMSNLFSSDGSLRVVGFDDPERWAGAEEFLSIFRTQAQEMPQWREEIESVDAFEEGVIGWASLFGTMTTPETKTQIRHTAVLRLEAGAWQVILWQNSIPVPNEQVFGVELTTTLDDLLSSVLDDGARLPPAASEGTLTLIFTDIVDSTTLAESLGDRAWAEIVRAHEETLMRITASEGGDVVKLLGDGSMLAFQSARAAVRAAVEFQRAFADAPVEVRVGIHTGEVIRTAADLLGVTVNKAARIASTAAGGEILASSTTMDMVGSMQGIRTENARVVALKGLAGTHPVVSIGWD